MSHVASNIRVPGKKTPLGKGLLATCKLHALLFSKSMKKSEGVHAGAAAAGWLN
jgi:hypothetical protein